ncbi:M14 family zinc carboxypeptidase [Lacinutrix sp. Bg11-31]|uniref:M14 family zinc carboxypeptidase n=1 Tax=Lacinutrix sp. Bg11-31 TaxID=2057808 RepID=UPI000C302A2F|nr:M14 family zinc carboxypeptidase [Lacinutrix sp. Bg11-31]AUC81333.1 peptidase M14 [Lacinutrix sp. Bg11-31]
MQEKALKTIFNTHKEKALFGRYIHTKHITPLLEKHANSFKITVIGQSVLEENIYSITIGTGKKKILMWSQMHGNESTTTKAIFDLLNFFLENSLAKSILKACTIVVIPILNPDGAKAYTRLNANAVDLNRDAQTLTQPESKVLKSVFNSFKPHYCFNLHGQRTIFSVGKTNNSASLSFLSPAQDKDCTITDNRKVAMSIIVKMNAMLQKEIPNQVGTYDDAFNVNCVGDAFQSLNVPTVLFEAGHCANDYDREEVRRYVFQSYIVALKTITEEVIDLEDYQDYISIPQNKKLFFDVIIKDAIHDNKRLDIAIQYQERLIGEKLHFIPKIEKTGNLSPFFAHNHLNASDNVVLDVKSNPLTIGSENDFVIINNVKFSLKFD